MIGTAESSGRRITASRWAATDGTRLIGAFPTEHAARAAMLASFQCAEDAMLCVDVTPVLQWLFALPDKGFDKDVDALFEAPVRPPAKLCALAAVVPTGHDDKPFGLLLMLARTVDAAVFVTQTVSVDGAVVPGGADYIALGDAGTFAGWGEVIGQGHLDRGVGDLVRASLSMFHVKNIGYKEVRFPRHVRRRNARGGNGTGPTVYRTLTLRPFSEEDAGGRRRPLPTGEVPLHLVRGHFATYSPERKLFGKYVGTFWRPEHLAGNASVAVVKKTYAIQPATVQ